MTFSERVDYGLQPLLGFTFIVLFIVRLCFSAAVGLAVGFAISNGLILPELEGSVVFAVGAGLVTFYFLMPTLFTNRGLHWGKSAVLRLLVTAIFLAVAIGVRHGVEQLELPTIPYLQFLAENQATWRTPVALAAGLLAALCTARLLLGPPMSLKYNGPNQDEVVIRGPAFVPYSSERVRYDTMTGSRPFVVWLFLKLPIRSLARHGMLLWGAPGSGKTTVLLWLIKSFLAYIDDPLFRCVLTDVKNEFRAFITASYPQLANGPYCWFINPFDKHSCAIDIAEFPKHQARSLARAFFPPPGPGASEAAQFFYNALIGVSAGCICGFKEQFGTNWTGAEWLEKMATVEGIREALLWDKDNLENAVALDRYMPESNPELSANVLATVAAQSAPYYSVFGGMREQWRRGQRFAFSKWKKGKSVVVFGWDANHEAECCALHGLFFRILRWTLLAEPESAERATLVVVDELASVAGPIADDLSTLQREGRSRGVVIALAAHSTPVLEAKTGSATVSKAMLSEPQNVGCLKLADSETAKWVAERLSGNGTEVERTETTTTTTQTDNTTSTGTKVVREIKQLVSPAQLMAQPTINGRDDVGVELYGNTDQGNVFKAYYPLSSIKRDLPRVPPFEATPFDDLSVLELKASPPAQGAKVPVAQAGSNHAPDAVVPWDEVPPPTPPSRDRHFEDTTTPSSEDIEALVEQLTRQPQPNGKPRKKRGSKRPPVAVTPPPAAVEGDGLEYME
jgi:hypothetical protein